MTPSDDMMMNEAMKSRCFDFCTFSCRMLRACSGRAAESYRGSNDYVLSALRCCPGRRATGVMCPYAPTPRLNVVFQTHCTCAKLPSGLFRLGGVVARHNPNAPDCCVNQSSASTQRHADFLFQKEMQSKISALKTSDENFNPSVKYLSIDCVLNADAPQKRLRISERTRCSMFKGLTLGEHGC